MATTIVLGASPDPVRFSFKAVKSLQRHGKQVIPIGIRKGKIGELDIVIGTPEVDHVDTFTLYLRAVNQRSYYDYIINSHPKRVVFNPGTINEELIGILKENDIDAVIDCTLVMLNSSRY